MTALTDFLFPLPERRNVTGILRWWESRRVFYNAAVGAAGMVSVCTSLLFSVLPAIGDDLLVPWPAIVVFGVGANLCYFLGPMAEMAITKLWGDRVLPVGPALFRMGLTFSVGLALLPTLLLCITFVFRLVQLVL